MSFSITGLTVQYHDEHVIFTCGIPWFAFDKRAIEMFLSSLNLKLTEKRGIHLFLLRLEAIIYRPNSELYVRWESVKTLVDSTVINTETRITMSMWLKIVFTEPKRFLFVKKRERKECILYCQVFHVLTL